MIIITLPNLFALKLILDVNECASSQCDLASTECTNTPGSFHCKCRAGFSPTLECRPVADLGLLNGGIPDESITVSGTEHTYHKGVIINTNKQCRIINYN